jgi:hypothetical protein
MTHHTLIGKHSCMLQLHTVLNVQVAFRCRQSTGKVMDVFSTLSLRDSDGDTGPFCWWTFRYPPWAFVDRGARKRMFPVTRDVVDRQRKKTCGAADRCSRLHFGFPTFEGLLQYHESSGTSSVCREHLWMRRGANRQYTINNSQFIHILPGARKSRTVYLQCVCNMFALRLFFCLFGQLNCFNILNCSFVCI